MKTAQKTERKPKAIRSGNGKQKPTRTANGNHKTTFKPSAKKLVVEMYGGEPYEYYPLGKYVVAAPQVCRGRPTFKYTRVEVIPVLNAMASGWTVKKVVEFYQRQEITAPAVHEAMRLASKALAKSSDRLA